MIRVQVKMEGDLLRELQNMGREARPRAKRILSSFVFGVTQQARRLAPDDPTGAEPDLRESIRGSVKLVQGGVRGSVIAGGAPLHTKLGLEKRKNPASHDVYAVVQHEDTTLHHARGQANFIGQPFMQALPDVGAMFDKELLSA